MTSRAHHATIDDDDNFFGYDDALRVRIDARFLHHSPRRPYVQNVTMSVKGSVLTITVNLKATTTLSSSGKSNVIASTQGNVSVPGQPDVKVGLNVYTSAK